MEYYGSFQKTHRKHRFCQSAVSSDELCESSLESFLHSPARCSWLQHSARSGLKFLARCPPVLPSAVQSWPLSTFSQHVTVTRVVSCHILLAESTSCPERSKTVNIVPQKLYFNEYNKITCTSAWMNSE